jgi:hypothetical protein
MEGTRSQPGVAQPHVPKRVDLFTLLLASLGPMLHPRSRVQKRKHGMCGRAPVWGPTFRYRVTDLATNVIESDPSWKGHHRARRLARAA